MSTHGETHGYSCICSRSQHCLASKGGEAFCPVKALCPSVGECPGTEVGEGGWEREQLHGSKRRGRENRGKGDNI